MIAGRFTFTGLSDYLTFQKIKQVEYTFPDGFDPEAKDLVEKLIVSYSLTDVIDDKLSLFNRSETRHNA